jgi:copper transport protein
MRFVKLFPLFALLLLCLSPRQGAQAHGYLVRSIPADRAVLERAPNQVQVWFSESLEPQFSHITVFDRDGRQVDLGGGGIDPRNSAKLVVDLPKDLGPGVYLVRLRPVFTNDGHAVSSTLVFWVGEPGGEVIGEEAAARADVGEVAWRLVLSLSLTLYTGAIASYALVLRPAWGNPAYAWGKLPPRLMIRLRFLLWTSLILALLSHLVSLLQITARLFQTGPLVVWQDELWRIVLEGTHFGAVWQYRTALLVAMLFIQIVAAQQSHNRPAQTHQLWLLNGALAALSLLSLSLISHAAGSSIWAEFSVLADYLHLLGVAVWVGGVVTMAAVLGPALAPLTPEARRAALLAALGRFSPLAAACLLLIIATGIYSSSTRIETPRDLPGSTYGLSLLAKWALFLPMLALGAWHHQLLHPERLSFLKFPRTLGVFPHSLRWEALLAGGVMLAAAWLPATPPPEPLQVRGGVATQSQEARVKGYDLRLTATPSAVGANAYDVQIRRQGELAAVESVRLRFSLPAYDLYTPPLILEAEDDGLWVGADGELSRAGTWLAYVDFVSPEAGPIRAAFRWEVAAEIEDDYGRQPGAIHLLTAGGVFLALGWIFGPSGARWARRQEGSSPYLLLWALGLVLLAGSLLGGYWLLADTGADLEARRNPRLASPNPVFADQVSLERGEALYQAECWACHGPQGAGQMPGGQGLTRQTPAINTHEWRDQDLYRLLEAGLLNRHPYGQTLSPAERWDLINYLQGF